MQGSDGITVRVPLGGCRRRAGSVQEVQMHFTGWADEGIRGVLAVIKALEFSI